MDIVDLEQIVDNSPLIPYGPALGPVHIRVLNFLERDFVFYSLNVFGIFSFPCYFVVILLAICAATWQILSVIKLKQLEYELKDVKIGVILGYFFIPHIILYVVPNIQKWIILKVKLLPFLLSSEGQGPVPELDNQDYTYVLPQFLSSEIREFGKLLLCFMVFNMGVKYGLEIERVGIGKLKWFSYLELGIWFYFSLVYITSVECVNFVAFILEKRIEKLKDDCRDLRVSSHHIYLAHVRLVASVGMFSKRICIFFVFQLLVGCSFLFVVCYAVYIL